MADKLHKTKGIVLRTVKYGETSLIVTIFTELFGIQSYIINGIRTGSKKSAGKAALFQPAAILDLVVYHNELKQLNRIKEFKWEKLYENIFSDVPKNAVAMFMVELLAKSLKQPESNPELFYFAEDCFLTLDKSESMVTANLPLFFMLHLSHFFGFRIDDNYILKRNYLDLREGSFVEERPDHPLYLNEELSAITSKILKAMHPSDLNEIRLNKDLRRQLLQQYEIYYGLQVHDFGIMKTLPVLREILS
jgi:DNA repair protein RecO (recombination protein O)